MREAFIAGAVGVGIPRCEDYNSGDHQEGVGYFQRAIYRDIVVIAILRRACSCIRPAPRGSWRCAPTRAPRRFCSMVRVRLACVTWTIATARCSVVDASVMPNMLSANTYFLL